MRSPCAGFSRLPASFRGSLERPSSRGQPQSRLTERASIKAHSLRERSGSTKLRSFRSQSWRNMSEIENFSPIGKCERQTSARLPECQFGFHRHVSRDNAEVFAWRGPRRIGTCFRLKRPHRGTGPICRRRSLSPQSLGVDANTRPEGLIWRYPRP